MKYSLRTLLSVVLGVACVLMAVFAIIHHQRQPPIVSTIRGDYEWRPYEAFSSHYSLEQPGAPSQAGGSLTWGEDPEQIYEALKRVAKFSSFTPQPETSDEWRENCFLLKGIYADNWHGFPGVRRPKSYHIENIIIDHDLPPRRLLAIRLESPVPRICGHKLFDEWSYSWVDVDTDTTVYNPRQSDEIIGTFERLDDSGEWSMGDAASSFSLPTGTENSTVSGVQVLGGYPSKGTP